MDLKRLIFNEKQCEGFEVSSIHMYVQSLHAGNSCEGLNN